MCDVCGGKGFVFSNNEAFEDEIQKCDTCKVFKTDHDAQSEYINWMMAEHNLNLQWDGNDD